MDGITEVDVHWIMRYHEWYTYVDVKTIDGVVIHEFYFEEADDPGE